MTQSLAVVADIGGTNTRVALADGATLRRETVQRFRNAEHSGAPGRGGARRHRPRHRAGAQPA